MFLIFVQNIGYKAQAKGFLYVDDAKVAKKVRCEDNISAFQDDLDKYYEWAATNNMEFNSLKFELIRYGRINDLKDFTSYISPYWNIIDEKEHVSK